MAEAVKRKIAQLQWHSFKCTKYTFPLISSIKTRIKDILVQKIYLKSKSSKLVKNQRHDGRNFLWKLSKASLKPFILSKILYIFELYENPKLKGGKFNFGVYQ